MNHLQNPTPLTLTYKILHPKIVKESSTVEGSMHLTEAGCDN
jgi:hypothetical protein